MYRNAMPLPRGGWRHIEVAGSLDNGPSEYQRAAAEAYRRHIKNQHSGPKGGQAGHARSRKTGRPTAVAPSSGYDPGRRRRPAPKAGPGVTKAPRPLSIGKSSPSP